MFLRVSEELGERMNDYVYRHSTSLNALVSAYFVQLLEAEEAQKNATAFDAEQV